MRTDPKALAQRRFADPQPLVTGIDVIGRCASDPPLVTRGLLDAVAEHAATGARVLEIGFGSGWLLEAMVEEQVTYDIHALDLSLAQTHRARQLYPRIEFASGDMERLPFRDGAFDVIVTCWALYFARDVDAAISEIKRCISPGGRLIAAASAPDHEVEVLPLMTEAVRRAVGRELDEPDVGARFDLETGRAHVERHFPHVELRTWPGEMVFDDAADVAALFLKWAPNSLTDKESDRVGDAFAGVAQERIARDGALRVRRRNGAFVCDL